MRKLLRSRATGAFLTKEGTWTTDLSRAFEVNGHADAARGLTPEEVEIYYSFDKSSPTRWDFSFPL